MSSILTDMNDEFASVPGTGRTVLEEAMTQPAGMAGLWVTSEAHAGDYQETIRDPPVTNGMDYGSSQA